MQFQSCVNKVFTPLRRGLFKRLIIECALSSLPEVASHYILFYSTFNDFNIFAFQLLSSPSSVSSLEYTELLKRVT